MANLILARITAFAPTAERPFALGLPTGSSPLQVYKQLIAFHRAGKLSFQHVVTFNMDEYVGLPQDHPQSYHTFMYTHLFSHIDIPPSNVHLLDGTAPDLQAECARYEAAIARAGGIDLFLAGVGSDGHIAFNEPGSSLRSRTRIKTLAQDTLAANARFFEGADAASVPKSALTIGVGTVLDAREVVVLALGASKARAVRDGVEGAMGHLCTLSALQMHVRAVVVVDEDATAELRVKTVKVCTNAVPPWHGERLMVGHSTSSRSRRTPRTCRAGTTTSWHRCGKPSCDLCRSDTHKPVISVFVFVGRKRTYLVWWVQSCRPLVRVASLVLRLQSVGVARCEVDGWEESSDKVTGALVDLKKETKERGNGESAGR